MSGDLVQDAIATLIALGALAVLVRRIVGFIRPAAAAGCASCPAHVCTGTAQQAPPATPVPIRLQVNSRNQESI
jgi:hypothetical protein